MKVTKCSIEGLLEIEPTIFEDERGYFFESYNKNTFKDILNLDIDFVQDNQSKSDKNILRGLHLQKDPFSQGKLVRVINGSVLDIAVDLRKNSETFGQYHKVLLTKKNKKMLWIPPGFAHGFITKEDNTIFSYKCTNFYNKDSELYLKWNDKDINIDWENENPILNDKDKKGMSLKEINNIL